MEKDRGFGPKEFSRRAFLKFAGYGAAAMFAPEAGGDNLAKQLADWDNETLKDPDRIGIIGPQIAHLAIDNLCRRFGEDRERFENNVFLLYPKEFIEFLKESSGCIREYKNLLQPGSPSIQGDQIFINLHNILYTSPFEKNPRQRPVSFLFEVLYHEGGHVLPKFSDLETPMELRDDGNQMLLLVKKRGLRLYGIYNSDHAEGKVCYTPYRSEVEEIFVQFLTVTGFRTLGIPMPSYYTHKDWVERFEQSVVMPLFNGDISLLIKHFINSDRDRFFQEIGIRKGFTGEEAKYRGEEWVFSVIKQGN